MNRKGKQAHTWPDYDEDGQPLVNLNVPYPTPNDWEELRQLLSNWIRKECLPFDQWQRFLPVYNFIGVRACKVAACRDGIYEFDDSQTG